MSNVSKTSSRLTQEWKRDIYRAMWTLGKIFLNANHDQVLIHRSLGVFNTFSRHVRQRYESHFGSINRHIPVANHSLVLLDSPGIVDEDYIRAGHGTSFEEWIPLRDGAIEFVKGLAAGLYSHIAVCESQADSS
jgi:hypothetical protein